MGALRKTVELLFRELTQGKELKTIAFGKPQIGTFEFATRLLKQWRKDEYGINAPPDTVYFVGDTPESDIQGTNQFDTKAENEWYSILVRTGVFKEGTQPAHKPRATVDTVLDAVKHGMKREFAKKMKEVTKEIADITAIGEATEPPSPAEGLPVTDH
jgi:ribonucleotide monophosphatase NagD (HAD superfamily)